MSIKFSKYHGLGNDYLVIEPPALGENPSPGEILLICHRNFGVGADGILYGPLEVQGWKFGVRIFNPDGSEAEKSGNGIRIFARYLFDRGLVQGEKEFAIGTLGGLVTAIVQDKGRMITVEMGQLSFWSDAIPMRGSRREVIQEEIEVGGERLIFCAATIGNPHCVIVSVPDPTPEIAKRLGPLIENHCLFPKRTNVQFLKVLDRHNIQIEIWERGAGYTLASGSSSCAAAGVAYRLGLCDSPVTVHMPGGTLLIEIDEGFRVRMTGSVIHVCDGIISDEMLEQQIDIRLK